MPKHHFVLYKFAVWPQTLCMDQKRILNITEIAGWTDDVGGLAVATRMISERLRCSISKAEKLAAGRYRSGLSFMEQEALVDLTRRHSDRLFSPAINKGSRRSAS